MVTFVVLKSCWMWLTVYLVGCFLCLVFCPNSPNYQKTVQEVRLNDIWQKGGLALLVDHCYDVISNVSFPLELCYRRGEERVTACGRRILWITDVGWSHTLTDLLWVPLCERQLGCHVKHDFSSLKWSEEGFTSCLTMKNIQSSFEAEANEEELTIEIHPLDVTSKKRTDFTQWSLAAELCRPKLTETL